MKIEMMMDVLGLFTLSPWMMVVIGILLLFYVYYLYMTWHFGFFKNLGLDGPRPIPLMGNGMDLFKIGFKCDAQYIEKYGKVFGTFMGRLPVMVIADPDMIKQIMIKEFSSFTNRFTVELSGPVGKNIIALKDEHWKHVRTLLTPTFSGMKLRQMTGMINHCACLLVKNLSKKADKDEVIELKEHAGAYSMDVIASTAFGLQADQVDKDSKFVKMAKKINDMSYFSPLILFFFFAPFLIGPLQSLGFNFLPKDAIDFFAEVTQQAMDKRQDEKGQIDFLQLMMNAHKEDVEDRKDTTEVKESDIKTETSKDKATKDNAWSKRGLTNDEILAQALVFFLAGYENVTNGLAFLGYNLAITPSAQDKLIEEIDTIMEGKEDPDYDVLRDMPYLDMCYQESLRLYPAAPRINRVCNADVNINGVFIPKGLMVDMVCYALHHDKDIWPDPEEFKPERFENKADINWNAYMPFGQGPRNCLGMRLAIMEPKMAIVHILRKFRFVTCEETEIPLKLKKEMVIPVNGFKLKLQRRDP